MGFYTTIKTLSQMFIYIYFRGGWARRSRALHIVKIIYLTQDVDPTLYVVSITL